MSEGADKPGGGSGTQSSEGPRWAADEPTAMWDEGALREKGFSEAADVVPTASGPATGPGVGGDDRSKVQAPVAPAGPAPAPRPAGGLSWPLTIAIACVVAVVVYFAVRLLLH